MASDFLDESLQTLLKILNACNKFYERLSAYPCCSPKADDGTKRAFKKFDGESW